LFWETYVSRSILTDDERVWEDPREAKAVDIEPIGNGYDNLELIARSQKTVVYRARRSIINTIVAVKMLLPERTQDPVNLFRLTNEAKSLSRCMHPSILKLIEFDITPSSQPFLVFEFIDGKSLEQMLADDGPLSRDRFVDIFSQICSGMDHVHQQGIVHRDLKPEHVMITSGGNQSEKPTIIGFGLCKSTHEKDTNTPRRHLPVGTPNYMSPEQCRGDSEDGRTDIYALGCTMYKALTGNPVFNKDITLETMSNQLRQKPPELAAHNPDLAPLQMLIDRCLEENADDRFQTMSEVNQALSSFAHTASSAGQQGIAQKLLGKFWPRKN
jgi:serine/threonine protein kinase